MKGNYAGKNRNNSKHVQKLHFIKNERPVCNVFMIVPTGSEDKNKTNCINCERWLKANK